MEKKIFFLETNPGDTKSAPIVVLFSNTFYIYIIRDKSFLNILIRFKQWLCMVMEENAFLPQWTDVLLWDKFI